MPHTVTMSNAEETTMDKTLAVMLEKLKKLGDEDNKELPNIEKYVDNEIATLLDAEVPIRDYIIKAMGTVEAVMVRVLAPHCKIKRIFELSGSVVEGATTARIFQVNKELEIEIDLMYNYATIFQEQSHLLEPVKDKPGFVRLPFCLLRADDIDEYIDWVKRFLAQPENEQYSLEQMRQYISPLVIRATSKVVNDHVDVSDFLNYMRDIYGLDSADGPNHKRNVSLTETTAAEEWFVSQQNTCHLRVPQYVMSADIVPAVHLPFWPPQASDWITRYRLWPPHDTIQSIVDEGCQLVPRTSPGGDVHSEWRLSFSRPEATLANLRSMEQKHAYYFFKMFFYRYLKCVESSETDGKTLFSYVIKTIMLWACEELHPKDKIWTSLEKSVQLLLFKLLGSLEEGLLSHYFIPEINLLEGVSENVKKQCVTFINRWISNVLMTAPLDLQEKREIVKELSVNGSVSGAVFSALESDICEMVMKELYKMVEKTTNKH